MQYAEATRRIIVHMSNVSTVIHWFIPDGFDHVLTRLTERKFCLPVQKGHRSKRKFNALLWRLTKHTIVHTYTQRITQARMSQRDGKFTKSISRARS